MNNKISVVHVTQALGGVETSLRNIIDNIDTKKFETAIICPDEPLSSAKIEWQNTKIFNVPFVREINPISDIKALLQTIKILEKLKPDIIHCHSAKGGFLGRLAGKIAGIPTIYSPHGFSYLSANSFLKKQTFLLLEKLARSWTSLLLTCSDSEWKRAIDEVGFDVSDTKIWINCSSSEFFESPRKKVYDFKYICAIGRPSYQKNTDMLVHTVLALRELGKPIRCVLIGAGLHSPLKKKMLKLIEEYELEDLFIVYDWIDHERALDILAGSECLVLTSRYEGLPYSVIEAMALGKAVVGTDVDGIRDCVVHNKTGYLVPPNAPQKMSQAIALLLNDNELKNNFGNNGRKEFLDNYDTKQNIRNLEKVYERIASVKEIKELALTPQP